MYFFLLFFTNFVFIQICTTYSCGSFKSYFKIPSLEGHNCKLGQRQGSGWNSYQHFLMTSRAQQKLVSATLFGGGLRWSSGSA